MQENRGGHEGREKGIKQKEENENQKKKEKWK